MTESGFETVVGAAADETEIVPRPPAGEAATAWSEADDEADGGRPPWRRAWIWAAAILIPLGVAAAVIAVPDWSARKSAQTVPTAPAATAAAPALPTFSGMYRIDFDYGQATFRGRGNPPIFKGIMRSWWVFHSSCGAECIASGAKLDDARQHLVASTGQAPTTTVLRFIDGVWREDAPFRAQKPCDAGAPETFSMSWEFEPLPNGTLHGFETNTVETDECDAAGNLVKIPFASASRSSSWPTTATPTCGPASTHCPPTTERTGDHNGQAQHQARRNQLR